MFSFGLGILVAGGISVAAITLTAKEIRYSPKNSDFKVGNTDDALNFLYKLTDYEIPIDTYFYDNTTKGKEIKRYKKINGKYYECDQYGNVEPNSIEVSVNINNLSAYKGTSSENLIAGNAGYANKKFILGEGENASNNKRFNFTLTDSLYLSQNNDWNGNGAFTNTSVYTFDVTNYKILYLSQNIYPYKKGINDVSEIKGNIDLKVNASTWFNNGYAGSDGYTITGYLE